MIFLKLENNIAVDSCLFEGQALTGWVASKGGAGIGWAYSDGVFRSPPQPEPEPPTVDEQIAVLEASITPRNLRGAALGDQFAIDKIQAVEDEIKALRE
jgi:hypothetical protein